MSSIKVGVVGLSAKGWASVALVDPLLRPPLSDKYTLTALSTRSPASASDASRKYSELTNRAIKEYTSHIANDEDVDLVVISVKAPSHKQAALPAIAAGKNLFIEWPCGNGLQEAREIFQAATNRGIKTMAGLQGRQSLTLRKAKELISAGKIGRVLSTSALLSSPEDHLTWGPLVSESYPYVADEKNGATMLIILLGHFLSSLTSVLGNFSSVAATTGSRYSTSIEVDGAGNPTGRELPNTGDDQVAVSGTLTSGVVASIHCRAGFKATKGRSLCMWIIDGDQGSIKIEGDQSMIQIYNPSLYLNGEKVEVSDQVDKLGNTGRAWLEFSKGTEGNYPTLEDAVKLHCVLDAVATSSREGRRVDLQQN